MQRLKELIKKSLGFYSPYSWVKWLRSFFAAADPEIFELDKLRLKVQAGNFLLLALTAVWLIGSFLLFVYLAEEEGGTIITGIVFCAGLAARLQVVAEAYPQLLSSKNYKQLQDGVREAEDFLRRKKANGQM